MVNSSKASVTTDKTDYAPGQIVTITGKGFQPNEDVAMALHERPDAYPDFAFTTPADNQGNFTFMQFAPQSIDIGRTFTLTAIGQASGFVGPDFILGCAENRIGDRRFANGKFDFWNEWVTLPTLLRRCVRATALSMGV